LGGLNWKSDNPVGDQREILFSDPGEDTMSMTVLDSKKVTAAEEDMMVVVMVGMVWRGSNEVRPLKGSSTYMEP